ncbi:hypothetical protein Tco_1347025 [Tanacetum coccineum]
MSTEMLQARENLMEAIQAFLKKYDQIPPKEKSMALLLVDERFLKIKQALEEERNQLEDIQELLLKLINDLQILNGIQLKQEEQAAKESSIPLRDIISELPLSVAIAPDLPIMDSLLMEDEHLNTIPETESDEENESSVKDLNLTPSESDDLSKNKSECDVPVCDDFSLINVYEETSVTFSNPLFNSSDDFTSSDDESLSDEDIPEDNVKIYSNPLFEFDDEYISSDVNPLFDEVLENIEIGGQLMRLSFYFTMEIEDDYHDSEGDIIYLESLLKNNTIHNLPPKVFFDHEPKCLTDEPELDNLTSMVKVFDLGIPEKFFSPTYVRISFEDRHYLSLTYVIRIFLPYFTYLVDSPFLLSSRSEDTIFDPDIFSFYFSSLGTGGISSEWNFHVL